MKICLILEGCYPYVHGGVSTWMHQVITDMPEHEFVLWVIGSQSKDRGKFVYDLPENVTTVHEVFLDDALRIEDTGRMNHRFTQKEVDALSALIDCGKPDWNVLFNLYGKKKINPMAFLRSKTFLDLLTKICKEQYPYIPFAEAFHSIRSMLLPVLHVLTSDVPDADCYHSICTGYGGLLAAMGAAIKDKPLLLTEHDIYTREREEEIIRAKWVAPSFKSRWIRFFYMLSDAIYSRADQVTSLFPNAMRIQCELGCDPERCRVIENGIIYDRFEQIPLKEADGFIDIGAAVRLAHIKDIKTMIYAYYELCSRVPNVRLHIMGGTDDEEYAEECYELARQLKLDRLIFTGRVDIVSYMEKLDFTLLTSISEGQPLSILESFAARRPCVTTDVGSCRFLLMGYEDDPFGPAGYCVPPMNRTKLADAMEKLCLSAQRRKEMGEAGQRRVEAYYHRDQMMSKYRALYEEVKGKHGRYRV